MCSQTGSSTQLHANTLRVDFSFLLQMFGTLDMKCLFIVATYM